MGLQMGYENYESTEAKEKCESKKRLQGATGGLQGKYATDYKVTITRQLR